MNFTQVLILSLVEGLTEFLPVSSTAHLLVMATWLKLPPSSFLSSFEIFIQLGALAAVLLVYGKKLWLDWLLAKKVIAAFIPTAVIGFLFYPLVKNFLLTSLETVAISLLVGGLVLIWFERTLKHRLNPVEKELTDLTLKQAGVIGLCQALALVPGVSRSGATVVSGLALGLSRRAIVEFSFLLAVPTLAAAAGYDLLKTGATFNSGEFKALALGFVLSFAFAYLAIKSLLKFISTHDFTWFGVYRVLLAGLIWFYLI